MGKKEVFAHFLLLICISVHLLATSARHLRYSGRIAENSPPGTPVAGVAVPVLAGVCAGSGATLKGSYASDFRLVRLHGRRPRWLLVSSKRLDREFIAMYELSVARCAGVWVPVQVEVTDVNDNVPRFTSANGSVEVDESAPLGTELARLDAKDEDAEANGRLTFYARPHSALLRVEPDSGRVTLVGSLRGLSRLATRLYVKDGGEPPLVGGPLVLEVLVRRGAKRKSRALPREEDDDTYAVSVPGGTGVGDLLFTVPDRRFERRWFEVNSDEDSPPVHVERDSGRVFLARRLTEPVEVLVKIHKQGGDEWYPCRLTLSTFGEAHLQWTMFPAPYLAAVGPDAAPGSVVYRLSSRQRDSAPGQPQFLLLDGGEDCFEVDRRSGDIRTTGRPLAPSHEYHLRVQAVDADGSKGPPATVSVLAGFRPPQFAETTYQLSVAENAAIGQPVGAVQAVSFQKKTLAYVLQSNPGNLFSINQENGALSLTRAVDFESGHNVHTLQVRASEPDTDLSAVSEVVVHITDENDCTPEFLHPIYTRDNVPENIAPGISLLQVVARDCDSGVNSEVAYSIPGADFHITSAGVVSAARRLDYERPNHIYEFQVVAVDAGTPPRTGTASVRIRVANTNDETPIFSQSAYKTFLSEDAGPDTLVAIVHANDPDGDGVSYAITGGNEDSNFLLDNQKGIIKLRRSPPPRLRGPQYVLTITATDDNASGGPFPLSSSAHVVVGINDINNNKPVFQECQNYSSRAAILENQPPGTFVLRVQAEDADMGVNGEVKYGIMHRDGVSSGFDIHPDTGVITSAVTFDRERQREFTLSVTATDQAEEPLIGICQIAVMVADQNDNDPKFENSRYQYFLREDTAVGTSFLRAAAHDDDQGSNAAIAYSLSSQTPAYLHINPSTGWIYVNQPISQTSKINQQIVASDGGERSSSVELTVIITNVHNQPPHWEKPEYWVTVPENTVRDAKILTVKATSALGDPRVTYNLEEGQVPETNMPVRFYLRANRAGGSASILVAENLDYETTRFFALRVRVQNVAAVPLASFATVYVNVTDVNDNVPFFLSSTYEATVPEGAEAGTSVAQVSAVDLDSGLHGTVRYAILKDESQDFRWFSIDPASGAVATRASFDREQKSSYLIEVQSRDASESARPGQQGQPNTDTAYVRIFVADVNDNAPAFPRAVYEASVEEDKEVGFVVITVTANDHDEGANAKLRYQIAAGNAMGAFDVEPEVGTIFVAQPLDYETERRFQLRLVASDGKWENETLVVVHVVNRNDEAPVFGLSEYHAVVQEEQTELPVFILEVSASDPDQDADQSALRYSLHGQGAGAGGEFTIDERSGRIYARRRLDREERPAWRFLVLATDEGGAGLTGFADVLLEVGDVNDNAPFFPCPATEADACFVGRVAENSPAHTSVMEMRAADLDDGERGGNAALTYSIVENVRNHINLDLFSVNAATGTIYTVLRSLDREVEERYLLVVEARDGGGLAGTGTATILVSDVNDHPPVFSQELYSAQVSEDLEVNSEVLVVSASDGDKDENAFVTFSIVGGDEDRKFLVETDKAERRGVIRLKKKVDFEKPQERTFNLTLKAEDADFFSLAHCLVRVRDANDHAPVFLPQFYESPPMGEDVAVGTVVAQVTAADLDSGPNGRFSYSVAKESDPYDQFLVDQSGWVVVAKPLDREKISRHRLAVLATDGGQPALTGTAVVVLSVLDVNDNGPEFEAPYRPVAWENAASPQAVWMNASSRLLHATDRDLSVNGAPFSIRLLPLSADAAHFNLTDFRNGSAAVTALTTFDRERQKEYRLAVLMIDSGSPVMSSTGTLTVVIGDRNDHPHSPGHAHFIVYSYEGVLPTTALGQIPSPDLDDWSEKTYRFEGKPSRLFSVNHSSGQLSIKEGVPPGSYQLQVRVSDPAWPDVTSTAQVDVVELPRDALINAASLRIRNMSVEELFRSRKGEESRFSRLAAALAEILGTAPEQVQVFSVGDAHGPHRETDVWFAAHGSSYYKAEKLHGYVVAHKTKLETALGASVSQVGVDDCPRADCAPSGGCSTRVTFGPTPTALNAGDVSLISLPAETEAQCGCHARRAAHPPCSAFPADPCLNGGVCRDGPLGYRCECPPMLDGPECQQTKRSFGGEGYAWFPPLTPCFQSHISLDFLTEAGDGLLLYDGPLAGAAHPGQPRDFISIELKNGSPVLKVDHGSGTLTLELPPQTNVADRRWHRLDVIDDGKAVQLVLDQCSGAPVSTPDSGEADESACRVAGQTPGNDRFLNVHQPLQLGGVKPTTHAPRYPGFRGCLRNLRLDTQAYDLERAGESRDSRPGCASTDGACVTAAGPSCGIHASCLADWGAFSCECQPGRAGHKCDAVVPEFSLDSESVLRFHVGGAMGDGRRTDVQMLLRTRSASGTLLSVTSREAHHYVVLEIAEGFLSVRVNLGDGAQALRLTGPRVDVGQWVPVSLSRRDNLFTLKLERGGGEREVWAHLGISRRMTLDPAGVTVGGGAFHGCLRDVRLNGRALPLDGADGESVGVLERRGVTPGCSSDACRDQPCPEPLRCVDLWRKHECRCPDGQVAVAAEEEEVGGRRCAPSPCGAASCRNGGACQALSASGFRCRCPPGFRGRHCELGQYRGRRLAALSPSSILAISMCLLVFFAVLVAVTVWNQKGSRNKFRKRGVYHIPAERQSWEDVRENILNYNEEGGGEQDQKAYDMTELKRPLRCSLSQSSSCTTAPLIKSSPGSQEEVAPHGAPYLSVPQARLRTQAPHSSPRSHAHFKSYVERIVREADRDDDALPEDAFHVWRDEGAGTPAGSLSSLGSDDERDGHVPRERLARWGPKFQTLSEMYDHPRGALL